MSSILCHLGKPRTSKPKSLREYGVIRNRLIQSPWVSLSDDDFIRSVTFEGRPFYGALMNGRDLMELQSETAVWRTQSIVGLDFDSCETSLRSMIGTFSSRGLSPWLAHYTFSNDPSNSGKESYRLLWKAEIDLNVTHREWSSFLKDLRTISGNRSDKFSNNPTRLWQGTNSGPAFVDNSSKRINPRITK